VSYLLVRVPKWKALFMLKWNHRLLIYDGKNSSRRILWTIQGNLLCLFPVWMVLIEIVVEIGYIYVLLCVNYFITFYTILGLTHKYHFVAIFFWWMLISLANCLHNFLTPVFKENLFEQDFLLLIYILSPHQHSHSTGLSQLKIILFYFFNPLMNC